MKDRFSIFITLELLLANWILFIAAEAVDENMNRHLLTVIANLLLPSVFGYLYVILDNRNKYKQRKVWYRRMLAFFLWAVVSLGMGYCITTFIEEKMWFIKQDRTVDELNGIEYLKFGIFTTVFFIFIVLMVDLFAKLRVRYFANRGIVVGNQNSVSGGNGKGNSNSVSGGNGKGQSVKEDSVNGIKRIRITEETMKDENEKSGNASSKKAGNKAENKNIKKIKSISEICSIDTSDGADD